MGEDQTESQRLYAEYLTPPRIQPARRELILAESGEAFQVGELRGTRWGEGPAVLLMHGWGGHSLIWSALVPRLLEHGLSVVAPDAPGHGGHEPSPSNMFLFVRAMTLAGETFGPFRGVVGHSIGATALPMALNQGLAAERVVLVSATARVRDFLRRWATVHGLNEKQEEGVAREWISEFGTDALDHAEPLWLAPSLEGTKALVIHDEGDPEAAFTDAEAIVAAWPGAALRATTRLGHARILIDRTVADEIARFLA